ELEKVHPQVVEVLQVLGAHLGERALRVEQLEQARRAFLVLDAGQVAGPLGALEQTSAHAVDQLAARGECSVGGYHVRRELGGRLVALDRLRPQVRLGPLHLALLLVEDRQRERYAHGDRGRSDRRAAAALLSVSGRERHFGYPLAAREVQRRAG